MRKHKVGRFTIVFYENGAIVLTMKTGPKKTDFNVYLLKDREGIKPIFERVKKDEGALGVLVNEWIDRFERGEI